MSVTVTKVSIKSLYAGLGTDAPNPPLVVKIAAPSVAVGTATAEGSLSNNYKVHDYIRMDVLPLELQQRIKMAVDALSSF